VLKLFVRRLKLPLLRLLLKLPLKAKLLLLNKLDYFEIEFGAGSDLFGTGIFILGMCLDEY
jgi:hypothetical protein